MSQNEGPTAYTYDAVGKLLTVASSDPNRAAESYLWDAIGNPSGAGYVVGPYNRLLATPTASYTYDAEGNRLTETENGRTRTLTWDHRPLLKGVSWTEQPPGSLLLAPVQVSETYDLFDRRMATGVNGVTTER